VIDNLEVDGWRCIIIWHCQLRTKKAASNALPYLLNQIKKN
jgi:G:T-mismatch repair DNA endonuclease (very short patch repair protein)